MTLQGGRSHCPQLRRSPPLSRCARSRAQQCGSARDVGISKPRLDDGACCGRRRPHSGAMSGCAQQRIAGEVKHARANPCKPGTNAILSRVCPGCGAPLSRVVESGFSSCFAVSSYQWPPSQAARRNAKQPGFFFVNCSYLSVTLRRISRAGEVVQQLCTLCNLCNTCSGWYRRVGRSPSFFPT